jgi:hypothetical protein
VKQDRVVYFTNTLTFRYFCRTLARTFRQENRDMKSQPVLQFALGELLVILGTIYLISHFDAKDQSTRLLYLASVV